MRGNNRKSIEKCRKGLPQFTTMNVIDGQAGLVIYSSLIFYSLTIDNILNIIVLLILAGISIVTLTRDNGILTTASKSKTETNVAEVIERARTDILGEQAGNSGEITKNQVNNLIANYDKEKKIREDKDEAYIITEKGDEIKVLDIWNGTFSDKPPTIGEAINTYRYGYKVKEYTVKTEEFTTGVWRIFYQDSNYAYLITDSHVGSYKPSDYYSSYTSGADVSIVGQKLSPMISSFFTENNTNKNIRAMAWLTDTSDAGMWSAYKNRDAVFAIGSPTLELFVASRNTLDYRDKINLRIGDSYGYRESPSINLFSSTDRNGIYIKYRSGDYWLASPGSGDSSYGYNASEASNGFLHANSVSYNSYAVRPIVCIPTSVFDSKYTMSLN